MPTYKFLIQTDKDHAPIYLRVNHGDKLNFKRKTGYFIDPKFWDKVKGMPVKSKNAELRNLEFELEDLKSFVKRSLAVDNNNGVAINGDWLQNLIDTRYKRVEPTEISYLINYGKHYVENLRGMKQDSINKYRNVVESLEEFEKNQKKNFLVKDVNVDFRNRFHEFLLSRPIRPLSETTAIRAMKSVKTIVYHARNNGVEISPQIYSIKGVIKSVPKVTLNLEEINILRNTEFNDDRYEATRDWLVISCFTAQRSSDLLKMNKNLIQKYDKHNFIVLQQKKTDVNVFLPIHPLVQEILDKRNGEFPPTFANDDQSNTAMYNRYLKIVCQMANIDSPAKGNLRNKITKKYETGIFPKWQLVTSHIGRRSFVTNHHGKGKYTNALLMNITGHTTEKMYLEYNGNQSLDYATQLADIWSTT